MDTLNVRPDWLDRLNPVEKTGSDRCRHSCEWRKRPRLEGILFNRVAYPPTVQGFNVQVKRRSASWLDPAGKLEGKRGQTDFTETDVHSFANNRIGFVSRWQASVCSRAVRPVVCVSLSLGFNIVGEWIESGCRQFGGRHRTYAQSS